MPDFAALIERGNALSYSDYYDALSPSWPSADAIDEAIESQGFLTMELDVGSNIGYGEEPMGVTILKPSDTSDSTSEAYTAICTGYRESIELEGLEAFENIPGFTLTGDGSLWLRTAGYWFEYSNANEEFVYLSNPDEENLNAIQSLYTPSEGKTGRTEPSEENALSLLEELGFDKNAITITSQRTINVSIADAIDMAQDNLESDASTSEEEYGTETIIEGTVGHENEAYFRISFSHPGGGYITYAPPSTIPSETTSGGYLPEQWLITPNFVDGESWSNANICISTLPCEELLLRMEVPESIKSMFSRLKSAPESSGNEKREDLPSNDTNVSSESNSIDTEYYSIDLSELGLEDFSKLRYESAPTYGEEDGLGIGYETRVYDGDTCLFFVCCYTPNWGPQGDFANESLGFVDTPDGTLSVVVSVDAQDRYEEAEKEVRRYAQAITLHNEVDGEETPEASDYVLPESDSRYYTEDELEGLSTLELYYARNEIFARHGRTFNNEDLNEYFGSQPWYHGEYSPEDFDSWFAPNEYEKANAALIGEVERELGSPYLN